MAHLTRLPKKINPKYFRNLAEIFQQLLAAASARWDGNHDGKLDLKEINAAIENPLIHGNESAIAAVLRRHLPSNENNETTPPPQVCGGERADAGGFPS